MIQEHEDVLFNITIIKAMEIPVNCYPPSLGIGGAPYLTAGNVTLEAAHHTGALIQRAGGQRVEMSRRGATLA